jgi:hypothetical protein
MKFQIVYKPLAQIEVAEAYTWYARPDINLGIAFLTELERVDGFLSQNPFLYPCIEDEIRRVNLARFPYSLFYVIDDKIVNILSCFHQHRDPKSRDSLLTN